MASEFDLPDTQQSQDDSQDTLELSIKNYDFSNTKGLEVMLKALDKTGKLKVLKKMAKLSTDSLMELIMRNESVRRLMSVHHREVLDDGVVSRQILERVIVRNSSMPATSTKYWAICNFGPASIASFVLTLVQDLFDNDVSRSKILVVVDGDDLAKAVTEELNKKSYAIFVAEAPKNVVRSYLHQLQNWPVCLVSSEVFSGNALGRMDAAVVFKRKPTSEELVSLEYQMSFNSCNVSAVVAPATEQGLFNLAHAFTYLKFYLPLRI